MVVGGGADELDAALVRLPVRSLVIANDLLTPFRKSGLMNSGQTFKHRDTILARGGTKDAADLVKEFLGRNFTFMAFEEYLTRDAMQRRSPGMRRSAWAS